ncbi:MAG: FAD-dependent thymidylate synthase [Patescibacteria group bacterium]
MTADTPKENPHADEIKEARERVTPTRRVTVPAMDDVLFIPFPVLDHGFVRVIDYMGDDSAIVQAARVSYGRGTKHAQDDRGLIRYLMRHRHTTPFEMCELKLHVKLPIFVARQWVRHRMASINEYSARYSVLGSEVYIPKPEHLAAQSRTNKQGRGDVLSEQEAARVYEILYTDAEQTYAHYLEMLNEDEAGNVLDDGRDGLARELARMNLTLNAYTEWYWKVDLHNLLHFLGLRADSHAQYEIRVYAEVILEIVKRWVPSVYDAFINYRLNGASFSAQELDVLNKILNGVRVPQELSGLSKREWAEFAAKLGKPELSTAFNVRGD